MFRPRAVFFFFLELFNFSTFCVFCKLVLEFFYLTVSLGVMKNAAKLDFDSVNREKCSGQCCQKYLKKTKLKKKSLFQNFRIHFFFLVNIDNRRRTLHFSWSTAGCPFHHARFFQCFCVIFPFLSVSMCVCFSVTIWTVEMSAINRFCLTIFLN